MTRRDVIRGAALAGAAAMGNAARQRSPDTNELNYREYCRCLPDALRGFASTAFDIRTAQLKGLTTRAHIQERQRWARETFWSIIGGRSTRVGGRGGPATARATGRLDRDGYVVEKLVYEGRPGEWISANLYLPKAGAAPFPGVLFQAGHTKNGKAGRAYQCCCQGLAQLGFAVLTFDPIGQGERTNYPGANGLTRFSLADDEHTVPGRQLLLAGETMTRLQLEDAITSLDVLASYPQVDARRLGAVGQSGGGTLTMMLSAVDDRIAAAIVSSGNTENLACANFRPPGSVDDAEQNFLGSGPLGFDRWDLLWPFAPRPLLILISARDFADTYSPDYVRNGREEYRRLAAVYTALGGSGRLRHYECPLPHALSYGMRLELYRWTAKWLLDKDRPIDLEPAVAPEPDSELWATRSGSVIGDLQSTTPFALAKSLAAEIHTPAEAPDLRKILGILRPISRPRLEALSTVPSLNCSIVAAEACSAPGVWVPMWIFLPHGQAREIAVILDPKGRNEHWQEGDLYQKLAEKVIVCVPDLRGIGDLRPEYEPGAAEYAGAHETEEAYAWASLILGRPLLGQRVQDLLAVIEAARSHFENLPIALLAARGPMTIPALCAAALMPDVSRIHLTGHLVSWRSLTETEQYNYPFSNFVPGVLSKTDLPYIAASIAPRPVTLAGCVDASGREMPEDQVRKIYSSGNVRIGKADDWSVEAWLSLL